MIATALSTDSKLLTDEDNPLIDRKYPKDTIADELVLPQIYSFEFTEIPDFSRTVMRIEPITNEAVTHDDVLDESNLPNSIEKTDNQLNETSVNKAPVKESFNTKPVKNNSQSLNQKINSKTLSKRQVVARAKAQAKEREHQKQLEGEKQHAEEVARYKAEVEAALLNPKIHEGLLHQRKSIADSQAVVKKHAIFGELAQDLQTIQLPETGINEQVKQVYEKAINLLNSAESNDVDNTANLIKAVQFVERFADNGIADAMLRKALWFFEGNSALNISQNSDEALKILQTVASQNDNRAEKLLSRLYYAGHLVEQDSEMGKYWLELAAAHGHPEAIRISQGIATMSVLKETQREENSYLKTLGIGFIALLISILLIFVVVKI